MSTITPPALDPAQTARLAAMLADNAAVHARIDPPFAAALDGFARALQGHAAISSLIATAPPPPPRRRLIFKAQKAEAKQRADEWLTSFLRDALPEDGAPLPSNRAIFRAAASTAGLCLPRRVIEGAIYRRWPEREEADRKGAPIERAAQ